MNGPGKSEKPKRPLSWDALAEERIRVAQEEGQFENLPGFGKPIPGIDEPHDELWWVKEKLKREQISSLPPALAIRLDVEKTRAVIATLASEAAVRQEVLALNGRIRQAAFGVTWGPPVDVLQLDVNEVVAMWQTTRWE